MDFISIHHLTQVFSVKQPVTHFVGEEGFNTLQQDPDSSLSVNLFLKKGFDYNLFSSYYLNPKTTHYVPNTAGDRPKKAILDHLGSPVND